MRNLHVGVLVACVVFTEYALLREIFRADTVAPNNHPVFDPDDLPGQLALWPGLHASSRGGDIQTTALGRDAKKIHADYNCKCPILGRAPYNFPQCGAFDRQIQRDLAPYQMVDMTSAVLDRSYNHTTSNIPPTYHFSIRGNVIRYKARNEGSYRDQLMDMLRKLQRSVRLPNVEFVLNTWDHPKVPFQDKVPVLSPCSNPARSDIVFPYMYSYDKKRAEESADGNGFGLTSDLREGCRSRPFKERIPKVHFRGGCTGPERGYQGPLYGYYTRARANMLTEKHPDLIDAGLVWDCVDLQEGKPPAQAFFHQGGDSAESDGSRRPRPLPLNRPVDWCNYRYYLLLDGNTVSGRSTYIVQMGFVLFKPESPFYEYWYMLLEPWVHYIPVEANLNDLPEKVRWANDHQDEAEKIAKNLSKLADVISREETWMCYWWRLLRGIAALQNFESRVEGFPHAV